MTIYMSASDYIKYKRVGTQLRDILPNEKGQAPAVFDDQMYIDFKQYTIENTITDTKLIENSLIPTGSNLVFDVLKVVSNCPQFPLCTNTDQRTNRIPMSPVYYNPQQPPIYLKQLQSNGDVYHNLRVYDQGYRLRRYGQQIKDNKSDCPCITNRKFSNSLYMSPDIEVAKYANAK